MKTIHRPQLELIDCDLKKKMVFLTGPRQVGKTWLAKALLARYPHSLYLNYDHFEHRELMIQQNWRSNTTLIVFDELHQMPNWKNFLKGLYDTKPPELKILVTGSARLEVFRSSGDSLAGRYYLHHLMPLSPKELGDFSPGCLNKLIVRGGFPEPYLEEEDVGAQRWRQQYIDGLIREDILNFENISDLRAMQLLLRLLQKRVGSTISYRSLSEDLQISPATVKKYLQILEALHIVFRVVPFSKNIARSLLKEPKLYFFDTGLVLGDEGAKYENFLAVCLLKHLAAVQDYEGKVTQLAYIRTKDQKEVDFCLVVDEQPTLLIEAKVSDRTLSPTLIEFSQKYGIAATQVVYDLRLEKEINGIKLEKAANFLRSLKL